MVWQAAISKTPSDAGRVFAIALWASRGVFGPTIGARITTCLAQARVAVGARDLTMWNLWNTVTVEPSGTV